MPVSWVGLAHGRDIVAGRRKGNENGALIGGVPKACTGGLITFGDDRMRMPKTMMARGREDDVSR